MEICLDCNSRLQDCLEEETGFTQYICWNCGFYASNSPAYKSDPDHFKNLIRNNPSILKKIINRKFTERKNNHRFDRTINNKRYIVEVL